MPCKTRIKCGPLILHCIQLNGLTSDMTWFSSWYCSRATLLYIRPSFVKYTARGLRIQYHMKAECGPKFEKTRHWLVKVCSAARCPYTSLWRVQLRYIKPPWMYKPHQRNHWLLCWELGRSLTLLYTWLAVRFYFILGGPYYMKYVKSESESNGWNTHWYV